MVLIRHAACVALVIASTLRAAGPHSRVEGAPDVFTPVAFDQQRLAGTLATRMRANVEGYLEGVDPQQLVGAPVSAGLFLIAASDSYDYSEDPNLKKSMDRVANAIVRMPPAEADSLGQAGLLAGLVAYSEETGRDDTLAAARKVADAHLADAGPVLVGPLTDLYRITDEERYMEAARLLSHKTAPEDTLERFVYAGGLVTYYRESGDDAALRKSAQLWRSVHPDVAGSPEASGNTCVTAAWFKWTTNLLRATGQPSYAEAAEATLYNQLLAAQSTQSGEVYGTVTLSGEKVKAPNADMCAAAEGWALATLPEALWGRLDNGIALMNYTAGHASFRLRRRTMVQIYVEGNYPETGALVLHVEPSRDTRFHLLLRVPRWSRKFMVEGLGNKLAGKPGEFVDLVGDWKKGDTVRISVDMPITQIEDPQRVNMSSLQRGPELLAVTKSGSADLDKAAWASDSATAVTGLPDQTFQTSGFGGTEAVKLGLVPFAAASGQYRVWLPKR